MVIYDGLGGEELGQAGSQPSATWVTGSITSESQISGSNLYAGTNIEAGNDVTAAENFVLGAGSPYGKGITASFIARSDISGGMFVNMSGGLAYAADASSKWPIGVAEPGADVASGSSVNVIVRGVASVIAEGTIAVGAPAMMGAGGDLNTIVAVTAASGVRTYGVFDTAGSEGAVFILL